jgi:7,8-dihydroneopterin aldolase/epimerase/oxygenase
MGLISLEGMEFFAYHGYYDEEQKIGNKYSIDLAITTDLSKAGNTDKLSNTISYEELYEQVKQVMLQKHRLLEHVGQQIIDRIMASYPQIESVKVSVSKHNPPIGGICQRARVELSSH